MQRSSDFKVVRRHALQERQVAVTIPGIATVTVINASTTYTTTETSSASSDAPASTTSPDTAGNPPASSSSTPAPVAPAPSSAAPASATPANPDSASVGPATTSPASVVTNPAPVVAPSTAAPAATSAAAASTAGIVGATTPLPASATIAASSSIASVLPSTALTTELSTAANGTVFTTVLPIGAIPSAGNPFGNVTALTATSNGNVPLASIVPLPGSTTNGQDSGNRTSHHSNKNAIIIPIAVIFGLLALGLLIWFFVWRQRRSMERDVRKPLMLSKSRDLSAITAGALGFTAAGVFKRGRRGEEYNQSSQHGHGEPENRSWLAGGPIAEEEYADGTHYHDEDQYGGYNDQRGSYDSAGQEGQHHTMEMNDAEIAAAGGAGAAAGAYSGGHGYSTHGHNDGPMDSESDQGHRGRSFVSGEGGYLTADEEDGPAGPTNEGGNYDGSAGYGYSNPATKGLDAAAVQGATGGQMLSPYPEVQRNNNRASNTTAYGGAEMGEVNFPPPTAESPTLSTGEGKPTRPKMNSSRWSG